MRRWDYWSRPARCQHCSHARAAPALAPALARAGAVVHRGSAAVAVAGDDAGSNGVQVTAYSQCFVNCTNTSNVKVKFTTNSFGSSSHLEGSSDQNNTSFCFERLGDSQ